jgi:hypothetical protein
VRRGYLVLMGIIAPSLVVYCILAQGSYCKTGETLHFREPWLCTVCVNRIDGDLMVIDTMCAAAATDNGHITFFFLGRANCVGYQC